MDRQYRTADGLPQDFIKAIAQTNDGYIWVATQEGLARFNGASFTTFTTRNSPGLISNNVHDIKVDAAGTLWIFANSGLSRYRNGSFEKVTLPGARPNSRVLNISIGRDGHLYVLTDESYYRANADRLEMLCALDPRQAWAAVTSGTRHFAVSNGRWVNVTEFGGKTVRVDKPTSLAAIRQLSFDRDENLWVGSDRGLWLLSTHQFTTPAWVTPLKNSYIYAMTDGKYGDIWIVANTGVYNLDGRRLIRVSSAIIPQYPTPQYPISYLYTDTHGWLLMASFEGDYGILRQFTTNSVSSFELPARLAVEWNAPMFRDREGNIWAGTFQGLHRLHVAPVHCYTRGAGLPMPTLNVVCQDRHGTVWTGSERGSVMRLVNDRLVPAACPELNGEDVRFLCADPVDGVWVGTQQKIVLYRNGRAARVIAAGMKPFGSEVPIAMTTDSNGIVWFACRNKVVSLYHGRWHSYSNSDALWWLGCTFADHNGSLWIGNEIGVSRLCNGRFDHFKAESGLPTVPVITIAQDAGGTIWLGTWGGGIYRYRHGVFRGVTVANGLYADSIQQILIDKAGMFWIGSSRGVFRVRGQELNNVLDGRARYVHCVPLSADEGGTGGPTRAPFQPSCLVGRDGSFWFCTWAGLLRIAHDGVQMPTDATLRLPTVIEHVQIDNRTYNPAVRVIAPPGNGRLRIDYAALGYSRPGKVIFRYMLSGIDPEWVDAGSQRFLYYTTLAPGDYVLRIRALDRDNFVRYTEATLTFRILPHFYQTTAFRLLVIFCAVIVGILFHLWRTAALRRRSAELEICVTERTQELIEAVGQLQELSDELMVQNDSLQAMQSEMEMQNEELAAARATLESQNHILSQLATTDALTGIANRRAFLEKLQQERSACSQKGEPLSLLLIDVDKFKNYNDTYGHPAGDEVLKKVAKLLQQEARQDDCVARYGGEEFVVLLPNTTQEKAIGVAERMRRAIEASEWTNLNVTASFGVATMCNVEMPMELLVEEADQALYESKRAGRNRCTHYRQLGLSAVAEAQKAA